MKKTRTAALICEFNPLHTGHEYILSKMRQERNVICIMSGNFVQRGGMAVADKFVRAKCAVDAGADLVIELPFPHAMGSAEYFATGAVSVLERLSCVDELWFGCECGDAGKLTEIAQNMLSKKYLSALDSLSCDEGYALSVQKFYSKLYGPCPELESPNNLLAIEYVKALIRLDSSIKPVAIKREGDFHSEVLQENTFPSATAVRKAISRGDDYTKFMPDSAAQILRQAEKDGLFPICEDGRALLCALRMDDGEKFALSAGTSGGLGNRIASLAHQSADTEEFFSALSTKKFTDARLRRTVYNCLFGIKEADLKSTPEYTQLLALNSAGREILAQIRKTADIPIITKPADTPADSRQAFLTDRADAYFTLSLPRPRQSGFFKTLSPYVKENQE